jgi:ABC-type multidrug transport system ATPase subunit
MLVNGRPEADFLADRIGIMVQGSLRCIGTGTHLKRTYGKGYKLTLTCPFNDLVRERINAYPLSLFFSSRLIRQILGDYFR